MKMDAVFDIGLYLHHDDLSDFFLINKATFVLVNNQHFWQKRFEIDNFHLISDTYSMLEYRKLIKYRKNTELILLINDFEYQRKTQGVIRLIEETENYDYILDKIFKLMPKSRMIKDDNPFNTDMIIKQHNNSYLFEFMLKGIDNAINCKKEEVIYILMLAFYHNLKVVDNYGYKFISSNKIMRQKTHWDIVRTEVYIRRKTIIEFLQYQTTS